MPRRCCECDDEMSPRYEANCPACLQNMHQDCVERHAVTCPGCTAATEPVQLTTRGPDKQPRRNRRTKTPPKPKPYRSIGSVNWAATVNPLIAWVTLPNGTRVKGWSCEMISPGCRNCYAGGINQRFGTGVSYKPGDQRAAQPEHALHLDAFRAVRGPRKLWFVCSQTDLFQDGVPHTMIAEIIGECADLNDHDFAFLTKRPQRMVIDVLAVDRRAYVRVVTGRVAGGTADRH